MTKHLRNAHSFSVASEQRKELEDVVLSLQVMPSVRALITAGPALAASHVAGYNSYYYLSIDSTKSLHEALYMLMHGTGVGFGGERQSTGARYPWLGLRVG
jgi:ribonucleoside-triphosphate reductase (thioredoxin)